MANLTFERAVETIVGMKGEIIQALGETFIMVGLSTTFAVIFGTILGRIAVCDVKSSVALQQTAEFVFGQPGQPNARIPFRHPDDCHDSCYTRHHRHDHRPGCRLIGIERIRLVLLRPVWSSKNPARSTQRRN